MSRPTDTVSADGSIVGYQRRLMAPGGRTDRAAIRPDPGIRNGGDSRRPGARPFRRCDRKRLLITPGSIGARRLFVSRLSIWASPSRFRRENGTARRALPVRRGRFRVDVLDPPHRRDAAVSRVSRCGASKSPTLRGARDRIIRRHAARRAILGGRATMTTRRLWRQDAENPRRSRHSDLFGCSAAWF